MARLVLYNLVFICFIALTDSSFLSKRCFRTLKPVPLPPAPKPIPPPPPPPPAPKPLPPQPAPLTSIETGNVQRPLKDDVCFYMMNYYSGKSVSFGTDLGVGVELSGGRSTNEKVCVEAFPNSDEYYIMFNKNREKVLDIYGGRTNDMVNIVKFNNQRIKTQRFKFVRKFDGKYMIFNSYTDKPIAVYGNAIVQNSIDGSERQLWVLLPA